MGVASQHITADSASKCISARDVATVGVSAETSPGGFVSCLVGSLPGNELLSHGGWEAALRVPIRWEVP